MMHHHECQFTSRRSVFCPFSYPVEGGFGDDAVQGIAVVTSINANQYQALDRLTTPGERCRLTVHILTVAKVFIQFSKLPGVNGICPVGLFSIKDEGIGGAHIMIARDDQRLDAGRFQFLKFLYDILMTHPFTVLCQVT